MNRISNAVTKARVMVIFKPEKMEELSRTMDLSIEEHALFQERKAIAQMDGTLTLDEAQLIYFYLGNSVTVFNKQELAVKYVLTMLFKELLANRLNVIA